MNARTKLIATIVLGAALLVPVAQAQSPDDAGGLRGPGGIAAMQAAATSSDTVRPDDLAVARGPGAIEAVQAAASTDQPRFATRPDAADLLEPGSIETVVVQPAPSGFDWGDALVGGLGGLGAALLLTGGFFVVTSQRNKARLA
jgi:hypothetical protein